MTTKASELQANELHERVQAQVAILRQLRCKAMHDQGTDRPSLGMLDGKTGGPSLPTTYFSDGHLGGGLPGGFRGIQELGCAYWFVGFVIFLIALTVLRDVFFD
jgi:hypothetical protein